MEKEFSLKKRIRRDRLDRGRSPCPQAITPPAFLFLISYDVKQLEPKLRRSPSEARGPVRKRRLIWAAA